MKFIKDYISKLFFNWGVASCKSDDGYKRIFEFLPIFAINAYMDGYISQVVKENNNVDT